MTRVKGEFIPNLEAPLWINLRHTVPRGSLLFYGLEEKYSSRRASSKGTWALYVQGPKCPSG